MNPPRPLSTPSHLSTPIIEGNLYFTIFTGVAIMKSGLIDLHRGVGQLPKRCLINPATVTKYWLTSSPVKDGMYIFYSHIPYLLLGSRNVGGHFFGTEVDIELIPDKNIEIDLAEFRC